MAHPPGIGSEAELDPAVGGSASVSVWVDVRGYDAPASTLHHGKSDRVGHAELRTIGLALWLSAGLTLFIACAERAISFPWVVALGLLVALGVALWWAGWWMSDPATDADH